MKSRWLKFALSCIAIFSVAPNFAAELENEKLFRLGFHAGLNTSFFNSAITEYSDPNSEFRPYARFSVLLGVKSKFQFSTKTALNIELNVSSRGGSYRSENKSVFYLGASNNEKAYHMRNFRLTYLELPVLVNFNLNELFPSTGYSYSILPQTHYFSFSAGLAPALNIGSSLRVNSFTEGEPISDSLVEIKSHYHTEKFDYAETFIFNSIIEFAYNIPLKDAGITSFNLRWTQSLNDVYSIALKDNYNMQTKMSTITLGASILF